MWRSRNNLRKAWQSSTFVPLLNPLMLKTKMSVILSIFSDHILNANKVNIVLQDRGLFVYRNYMILLLLL